MIVSEAKPDASSSLKRVWMRLERLVGTALRLSTADCAYLKRKNLDFLVAKTRVILLGTMANHEFLAKAMSAEEYTATKVAAKLDCEDYKECVETEGSTESDWASLAEKNVALEAEEAAEALGRDGWELELKIP